MPQKQFTQCFVSSTFISSSLSSIRKVNPSTNIIPISFGQHMGEMGMFGTRRMYMRASDPWGRAASPAHDTPCFALPHEKCRACPLEITVMFISNTSNRLIRGHRVKGEGACNLCLVASASWRYFHIPGEHGFVKMEQYFAFVSGDNFQTSGSMADCAGALDPISDRRRGDGWAWEASIIMIRPSSSLIRGSILSTLLL